MNSETKILLPCIWPIVLRSEAKNNTQHLCCAVTTDSEDGRSGFELPCGTVRLSEFLIIVLGSFLSLLFSLAALKVLFTSSQLVSVKYNSETTIQVLWLSRLSHYKHLKPQVLVSYSFIP